MRRATDRPAARAIKIPTPLFGDAELLAAVWRKRRAGKEPNRKEAAAVSRAEKIRDAKLRLAHYKSVPAKDYEVMSGRLTDKTRLEQDARFGIPIGQPTINLFEVIEWITTTLTERGHKLLETDEGLDDPDGPPSPERERLIRETRKFTRLKRLAYQRTLLDRGVVHRWLAAMTAPLREALDRLQRRFGVDAAAVILDAVNNWERCVDEHFAPVVVSDDASNGTQ